MALLQESHLEDNEHLKLKYSWVGQVYFSSFTTSSRGVVILIHKNLPFQLKKCIKDKYGRFVIINGVLHGKEITIMNLYCPPNYSPDFLTKAFSEFAEIASPLALVGGDFNCLLNPRLDRHPPRNSPLTNQAKALLSTCGEINLIDTWRALHPSNREFTFYSHPHKCHTRIDYFFVPQSVMQFVSSCSIGNIVVSDHAIVLLELSLDIESARSKRWRFDTRLLKDDKFVSHLKSEFRIFLSINSQSTSNPSLLWETTKAYVRGLIIAYSASKKKKQLEQQLKLEKELADIKDALCLTSDPLLLQRKCAIQAALDTLLTQQAKTALLFSKQRLYEYGDKPSKYLSYLTKIKRDPQVIPSILDENGIRHFNNKNINNTFRQFYIRLYESDQPQGVPDQMESFLGRLTLPTISDSQKRELNAPISREEALLALKSLQSGKAPGPDGLSSEFYREFQDVLLDPLLEMLDHSFITDSLPQSLREADITLILKKGKSPEDCSGYRPIALLNQDIKILSKILAIRLEKVLPSLIKEDQTGFIKGRSSSHNVRRLLHIINICQTQEIDSMVISLDAEKAFDRVEWPYLFNILHKFNLGDNFVRWVQLLYKNPMAAVITNGYRSDNFPLYRSTRQGCPLSPALFALAIEPLAEAIRQDSDIIGINVGEIQHKISLYADDVLLYVLEPETSVPRLVDIITLFGCFSGYKINFSKSLAMPMGSLRDRTGTLPAFPFKWSMTGFVYLGIHITPLFHGMYRANFNPLLDSIRKDLDRWAPLPLSLLGRVSIIKMNILPRLLYPLQMIPLLLSGKVLKLLNGWLSDFIWNKRKPRLKVAKLQLPSSKGGLDLPNIRWYQLASHLRFIAEWVKEEPTSDLLSLEKSQTSGSLLGLLAFKDLKSARSHCKNNPIICNTLKAWFITQKLEGRSGLTSSLIPIQGNPNFLPGMMDGGYSTWSFQGIKRMRDLFQGASMLSFAQLQEKYNLPRHDFYKYLQIRDFINRGTTLNIDATSSAVEQLLLLGPTKKSITRFYNVLSQADVINVQDVMQKWQDELGIDIDGDKWTKIWTQTKKISVCNRARLLQFKIVHRIQISPNKRHKMNPQLSPACLKCKISVGTYTHCIWSCPKIQTYWMRVLQDLEKIFGVVLHMDPLSLILGYTSQDTFVDANAARLYNILTYAARKNIFLSWISDKPPTKSNWHKIIMECFPLEYLTCLLHSSKGQFMNIWTPYLRFSSSTVASVLSNVVLG